MKDKESRILFGRYFGYPECCIEEFINPISSTAVEDMNNDIGYNKYMEEYGLRDRDIIEKNWGFIPCRKCRIKIVNNKLHLSDLISNRKEPEAFARLTGMRLKHY